MDLSLLFNIMMYILLAYLYWTLYKVVRIFDFAKRFENAFKKNKQYIYIENPLFKSNNYSQRFILCYIVIIICLIVLFFILKKLGWLSIISSRDLFDFFSTAYILFFLWAILSCIFLPILICVFGDSIVQNEDGFLVRAFGEEYFFENKKFTLYIDKALMNFRRGPILPHQMIYLQKTNGDKNDIILCLLPNTAKNKKFIEEKLILQVKEEK